MKTKDGFEVVSGMDVWDGLGNRYKIQEVHNECGDYLDPTSFPHILVKNESDVTMRLDGYEVYGIEATALEASAEYWKQLRDEHDNNKIRCNNNYQKMQDRIFELKKKTKKS